MSKVVTFGEVMLRFNPEGFMRISQVQKFEATLAGSESNVAVSLANFGIEFFEGRKNNTAMALSRSAFFQKKYNRDTLAYMIRHYDGSWMTSVFSGNAAANSV